MGEAIAASFVATGLPDFAGTYYIPGTNGEVYAPLWNGGYALPYPGDYACLDQNSASTGYPVGIAYTPITSNLTWPIPQLTFVCAVCPLGAFGIGEATLIGNNPYRCVGYYIESQQTNPINNGDPKICPNMVGDPINLTTGNKYQAEDLAITNTPSGISFTRYYNSQAETAGPLGVNWQHTFSSALKFESATTGTPPENPYIPQRSNNYSSPQGACEGGWNDIKDNIGEPWVSTAVALYTNIRCEIYNNGKLMMILPIYYLGGTIFSGGGLFSPTLPTLTVTVIRPDGKQIQFSKINGVWRNQSNMSEHLTETDDSNGNATSYTYTTADDNTENFDATGKILSITDIRGNTKTIGYDTQGRLSTVTTNTAESLTFGYDTANRINTMTDHMNRVWPPVMTPATTCILSPTRTARVAYISTRTPVSRTP